MVSLLEERVREIVNHLLGVLQDKKNYLFSDLAIEDEVEQILDQIIEDYLGKCNCEEQCGCGAPKVVVSYSVLQKILLMLVQAKIETEDLSECLLEMEEAEIIPEDTGKLL